MNALEFRIRTPDGRTETVVVDGDRALVGSGAHCEIRLPPEHAAVEHVAVSLGPAGVYAEARSLDPAPTLNGTPFTQGPVLPDAILGVGLVQIGVSQAAAVADARVVHRKHEKTNPLVYVLAAVAVPLSLWVILADEPEEGLTRVPSDVPALFAAPVAACPEASPEQALSVARDKVVLAAARRERRPFHVQDGVAAVPLFEIAGACAAAGGDAELARDAAEAASLRRLRVGEDFRTHRVRLEHAISIADWATAHREVRVLRAMLEGRQGEYVTWLSNLDRKLQLKYGKKG